MNHHDEFLSSKSSLSTIVIKVGTVEKSQTTTMHYKNLLVLFMAVTPVLALALPGGRGK